MLSWYHESGFLTRFMFFRYPEDCASPSFGCASSMAGTPPLTPKAAAAADKQNKCAKATEAERKERQALAQAVQAEKEAADATKEIDALVARQREALQRAAAARKSVAAADTQK